MGQVWSDFQCFSMFFQCLFIVFSCFSMLFQCSFNAFQCFSYAFSMLLQCFFNASHCFFNAFQCFFNAFPCAPRAARPPGVATDARGARQRCTTEFYNGAQARAKAGTRWHAAPPHRCTTEFRWSAPTWRAHSHPGPAAACPLTPGARTRAHGLRNVPEPFWNLV